MADLTHRVRFDPTVNLGHIVSATVFLLAAGTTSSTTFKVHIGSHSATAWMINGSTAGAASGRKGGGISYSTIDIVEYAP